MSSLVPVAFHPSQFPDAVRNQWRASLAARRMNPKFHYDTVRRAHRWLAVHTAHSPAVTDPGCLGAYGRAFEAVADELEGDDVEVVSLGCGGGQKDVRLLQSLAAAPRRLAYVPLDVSAPLTLIARAAALGIPGLGDIRPIVADLAEASDLAAALGEPGTGATVRLVLFFGMLPNFEPGILIPRLAGLLRPGDVLLLSANLAPGAAMEAGVRRVLPQYDNPETRRWLGTVLEDHGASLRTDALQFAIEQDPGIPDVRRIVADWVVAEDTALLSDDEAFPLRRGEHFRLFTSYRHTPDAVRRLLGAAGIRVDGAWTSPSGEEGVFLARKAGR